MRSVFCTDKQNITDDLQIERGIIALVGGGGKTTLMYALASALGNQGRVIVTTSTHIFPPIHLPIVSEPCKESLAKAFQNGSIVCVGRSDDNGKLIASSAAPVELLQFCDCVLVEADGAKRFPLKAPAEHEPVIPQGTAHVIAVAGLDGVGKAIDTAAFRAERYAALLKKQTTDIIEPQDVAFVLQHSHGQRKGVDRTMRFSVMLNKADTPELRSLGEVVAEHLDCRLVSKTLIASLGAEV